jgi:hypothetical protein
VLDPTGAGGDDACDVVVASAVAAAIMPTTNMTTDTSCVLRMELLVDVCEGVT